MTGQPDYGVTVWRCEGDHAWFPRRLVCPRCGSTEFRPDEVTSGWVEEVTFAPATGVRLVTARTADGVLLIGRADEAVCPGDRVPLSRRDGIPGALYIPDSDHS